MITEQKARILEEDRLLDQANFEAWQERKKVGDQPIPFDDFPGGVSAGDY